MTFCLRDDLTCTEASKLNGLRTVSLEDDLTENGSRCVVEVHRCARETNDGLNRALNELGARLREHRDRHVLGKSIVFKQ